MVSPPLFPKFSLAVQQNHTRRLATLAKINSSLFNHVMILTGFLSFGAQVLLGNTIRFVDGIDVADMKDEDVAQLIVGSVGQPVVLVLMNGRHPRGNLPPLSNHVCVCLVRQPAPNHDAALRATPRASQSPPTCSHSRVPRVLPVRSLGSGPVFVSGPARCAAPSCNVNLDVSGDSWAAPCEIVRSRSGASEASDASTDERSGTPDVHDSARVVGRSTDDTPGRGLSTSPRAADGSRGGGGGGAPIARWGAARAVCAPGSRDGGAGGVAGGARLFCSLGEEEADRRFRRLLLL